MRADVEASVEANVEANVEALGAVEAGGWTRRKAGAPVGRWAGFSFRAGGSRLAWHCMK